MCLFDLGEHVLSFVFHPGIAGVFVGVVDATELAESIVDFFLGCLSKTHFEEISCQVSLSVYWLTEMH